MHKHKDRYVEELERKCVVLENKCKTQQTVILKLLELLKKSELINVDKEKK
jgi:hypothetical protein